MELVDTLFDFSNEEMHEDAIDKSYLDGLRSVLLNSPYDADDEMPKVHETEEPAYVKNAFDTQYVVDSFYTTYLTCSLFLNWLGLARKTNRWCCC